MALWIGDRVGFRGRTPANALSILAQIGSIRFSKLTYTLQILVQQILPIKAPLRDVHV